MYWHLISIAEKANKRPKKAEAAIRKAAELGFAKALDELRSFRKGKTSVHSVNDTSKAELKKPKRRELNDEEKANTYLDAVLKTGRTYIHQDELENHAGLDQSTWSRAMRYQDFWDVLHVRKTEKVKELESQRKLLEKWSVLEDDRAQKAQLKPMREKVVDPESLRNLKSSTDEKKDSVDKVIRRFDRKTLDAMTENQIIKIILDLSNKWTKDELMTVGKDELIEIVEDL